MCEKETRCVSVRERSCCLSSRLGVCVWEGERECERDREGEREREREKSIACVRESVFVQG